MTPSRRPTRAVRVGPLTIGGGAPVSVQSMAKARPQDVDTILAQIREAADLGCELMRLAVPDHAALGPFAEVKRASPLPLVADVHFTPALALEAVRAGADKIRINPGNTHDWEGVAAVVREAKRRGVAVRVGVNSGSIRPRGAEREAEPQPDLATLLADEALSCARRMHEELDFDQIVLSLKAHDAATTMKANRLAAEASDWPLHLGVTAAGPREDALLKSAVGVGGLLAEGMGDTIRLSFTGPPAEEVRVGRELLRAAGVLHDRVEIVSCPTCGRCKVDLRDLVDQVKARVAHLPGPLTVAVMGCEVNGPGEASDADVGLAAGGGRYALFEKGRLVRSVDEPEAVDALCAAAERLAADRAARAAAASANQEAES